MQFEPGTYRIEQLIEAGILEVGDGYRAKNSELSEAGVPFARAGNINDGFRFIGADRFPISQLHKVGAKISRPGDVVFTSKGTVGRFAFVTEQVEQFVYSPQLCFWRSRSEKMLDSRFLFYWMQGPECMGQIEYLKGQTDMADYVSLRDQRRMTMTIVPLAMQRAVASILSALDDRIYLLRQTNATLESIAQALFKSWFIDFDPVRAKAEGREPEGMDANAAALFPDSVEDSALGEIPKGWQAITLGEAFELNPSRSLKKGGDATYLEMANASTTGHRPLEHVGTRPFGSGCKFRNGDALLAKITPCLENGKSAFVDFLGENEVGWGSTEFIVLHSRPKFPKYCAYLLARYEPFRQFAIQAMTGTSGRQRIDLSRLMQFPLAAPPDERIAVATETVFGNIQTRIAANDNQAKTLAALRDALLPGLISGKLSLSQAEAQLNEALA